MSRFTIRAEVTAEVIISIEGYDKEAALAEFDNSIMLTANLADTDPESFMVLEDSISEVGPVSIEEEDE